jgi:hypothetical protein
MNALRGGGSTDLRASRGGDDERDPALRVPGTPTLLGLCPPDPAGVAPRVSKYRDSLRIPSAAVRRRSDRPAAMR